MTAVLIAAAIDAPQRQLLADALQHCNTPRVAIVDGKKGELAFMLAGRTQRCCKLEELYRDRTTWSRECFGALLRLRLCEFIQEPGALLLIPDGGERVN